MEQVVGDGAAVGTSFLQYLQGLVQGDEALMQRSKQVPLPRLHVEYGFVVLLAYLHQLMPQELAVDHHCTCVKYGKEKHLL